MASESEAAAEMQSVLERLISSRNRDLSLFIPFLLGFTGPDPGQTRPDFDETRPDPDRNSANQMNPDGQIRERIILINPLTQGMVVIEGTGLDTLFRGAQGKDEVPPASKSAVEAMPRVEIREGEEGECAICLEEWAIGGEREIVVKEMPCKHRFHGGCIEKWLGLHGSCPVCRFKMPVEEEDGGKKREEREEEEGGRGGERRRAERGIWVSFSFGSRRRRTEEEEEGVNGDRGDEGLVSAEEGNRTVGNEN